MRADELKALAERVMRLEKPCRKTDALIALAVGISGNHVATPEGWCVGGPAELPFLSPTFTASLDAAMTLVPDDWSAMEIYPPDADHLTWVVYLTDQWGKQIDGTGASFALALTAAALLAKAAQIEGEGK